MRNLKKPGLGFLAILAILVGFLFAATVQEPKVKVDVGTIKVENAAGTGRIYKNRGAYWRERWNVFYTWEKETSSEAIKDPKLREQVQQAVESYITGTGSLSAVQELINSTLLTGYHYTIFASELADADFFELPVSYIIGAGGERLGSIGTRGEIKNRDGEVVGKIAEGGKVVLDKALTDILPEGTAGKLETRGEQNLWLGASGQVLGEIQAAPGTKIVTNVNSFDPFDVYGLKEKVVPGSRWGSETENVAESGWADKEIAVNLNNQGLFDLEMTGKGEVSTIYTTFGTYHGSPIVLDMDGDGKLSASGGDWLPHPGKISLDSLRAFDLEGTSFEIITEWIGKGDGLLCEPKADGSIDGTCLFGPTGGYDNGYDKLGLRDNNKDKQLTAKELDGLFVWQDKNSNARADQGELLSLAQAGISRLSLEHKHYVASFIREGKEYTMWDWWPNCLNVMKVAVRK